MISNQPDNPVYREAERRAARRVKFIQGFYWHLGLFIILNVLINCAYVFDSLASGGWHYPWIVWPVIVTCAVLFCHFLAVFVFWEGYRLRQIERELQRSGIKTPDIDQQSDKGGRCFSDEYFAAYRRASGKIKARLGLYWHLVGTGIANVLCLSTYLVTALMAGSWYYPWFVWVFATTGAAWLAHYLWVSIFYGNSYKHLFERELRKYE